MNSASLESTGGGNNAYRTRRMLTLASLLLLLLLPLFVFLEEVGGMAHYFGDQYPPGQGAYIVMRAAGHIAIVLVFVQAVLGRNVRAVARWLGLKSLVRVHMSLGASTLSFALLHPLLFLWARSLRAEQIQPLKVFFPTPGDFYHNRLIVGAVALYMIAVAAWAGAYGPRMAPRLWRRVHLLNYGVFFVAWYHAVSIGSETRHPLLLILYGSMLVMVAYQIMQAWKQRRSANSA